MSPLTILLAKRKIGMTLGAYKSRLVLELEEIYKKQTKLYLYLQCASNIIV